jgi:hypothetical protein
MPQELSSPARLRGWGWEQVIITGFDLGVNSQRFWPYIKRARGMSVKLPRSNLEGEHGLWHGWVDSGSVHPAFDGVWAHKDSEKFCYGGDRG